MNFLVKYIDAFLNNITMYRLVMYGLGILASISIILGFFSVVGYSGVSLLLSLVVLVFTCYGFDMLVSRKLHIPKNEESSVITALILFFIFAPALGMGDALTLVAAAIVAILSKYVLTIKRKHIFNPAAIATVLLGFVGSTGALWWVGTPSLLLPVAVLGLLVVRKLRRFDLFWSFIITSSVVTVVYDFFNNLSAVDALYQSVWSWPLVFFATIMLTEPSTTPPQRAWRIAYGVLVGVVFSSHFHMGSVYATPEFSLVVGNIFAYLVSSRQKLILRFKSQKQLSANVYEFAFEPDQHLRFLPGQYLEWTLPHQKSDTRGNRRYFTIASHPGESLVKVGVRVGANSSSFKKALSTLKEGDIAAAGNLSGDFVLPKDASQKLVFIAGGVGITPFASMVKHLVAVGEKRDIAVLYVCSSEDDFAYKDLLEDAKEKVGVVPTYIAKGFITEELIRTTVPDFKERMFYISGPQGMVRSYRDLLTTLGISWKRIRTDYFPGF